MESEPLSLYTVLRTVPWPVREIEPLALFSALRAVPRSVPGAVFQQIALSLESLETKIFCNILLMGSIRSEKKPTKSWILAISLLVPLAC